MKTLLLLHVINHCHEQYFIIGTLAASWTYVGSEDNSTIIYGEKVILRLEEHPDYSLVVQYKNGETVNYELGKIQSNDEGGQSSSRVIDEFVASIVRARSERNKIHCPCRRGRSISFIKSEVPGMNKLRIGLIGVGGIATTRHIPTLLKLADRVTIVAVSDIDANRASSVAAAFNIPKAYQNYEEMFHEIDAVFISTPNKFHAEITIAAMTAGLHVFCEKPMALTSAECEAMVSASKQAGKILSIGYHYRFMKEPKGAKRIMASGAVGNPLVVRVQAIRRRKVPGWGVFTNKELQGGGSLIDYGCHLLDLSLWLIGHPEPVEVMGTAYNALSRSPGQVNQWGSFNPDTFEVDDHVTAYIKFAGGTSLLLETSWSNNIKEDVIENVSISGEKGGLDVFPLTVNYAKEGMLFNSEAAWIPGEEDPSLPQAENFINACQGLEEQLVKPEEAWKVSAIIEKIYESTNLGTSVRF
ncbi:Gfo/Idh/MocA family protein [Peribacillus glennii]|nr:Gfo/Idh/MocA family oxidoreductase [Peribacillus glennii]